MGELLPEYGHYLTSSGAFAALCYGFFAMGMKRNAQRKAELENLTSLKVQVMESVRKRYLEQVDECYSSLNTSFNDYSRYVRVEAEVGAFFQSKCI